MSILSEDIQLLSRPTPENQPSLALAATLYLPDTLSTNLANASAATRENNTSNTKTSLDANKLPGLIVCHGAGSKRSNHTEFSHTACESGFVVLNIDLRGHGDSSGMADGPLELDICAAVDFLRAHPAVDAEKICYRGSSMGGFYGLKAAELVDFAALVLVCPASDTILRDTINGYQDEDSSAPTDPPPRWDIPALKKYFLDQDYSTIASFVKCPTLITHVRTDEVVPFAHSLELTQNLMVETTLIALAVGTHSTAQHDSSIHRRTLSWLHEQLDN